MKINLVSGRRAKNDEMEERLNRYMDLMKLEVGPEDVNCLLNVFFKTCASFHLVTARGNGSKSTFSCPGYYQEMVCKHVALIDMLFDYSFKILEIFVDECTEFRRRKGGQKQDEAPSKKNGWDGMICGDLEDSDGSEMTSQRDCERYVQERAMSMTGSEAPLAGEAMNVRTIPTPGRRKIGEGYSVDSAAPTFIGDGKMGRARSQSRGVYAMGSPRTNTSRFFSTKDDTEETETESVRMDNTAAVSS